MIYVLRLGYKIVGVFDTEKQAKEVCDSLYEYLDENSEFINDMGLSVELPDLLKSLAFNGDRLQIVSCPLNTLLDQLSWSVITGCTVKVNINDPPMI